MFILFFANQSLATIYCVANEAQLIDALDDAKDNGADDVIKIQQDTYYGNFVYASTESFGITIEGGYSDALCTLRDVAPDNTILEVYKIEPKTVVVFPPFAAHVVLNVGLDILRFTTFKTCNAGINPCSERVSEKLL